MRRRQPEKAQQTAIVRLLSMLGRVWVLGTRRRRGSRCPNCGTFVPEDQRTRQSPGLPDLIVFLRSPNAGGRNARDIQAWLTAPPATVLFQEVKAPAGTPSPDQLDFAACCQTVNVPHVMGDLDATITWLVEHGYLKRENVAHYRRPAEARA